MLSGPESILAWKISVTLLHALAFSAGFVRVFQRWRTKLMWWDDYVVIVPITLELIMIVLFWVQFKNGPITWDTAEEDTSTFLFSWWFYYFDGFSTLWGCRISMAFSLVRIFMPGNRYRKAALLLAGTITFLYATSLLVTTLGCRGSPWWDLKIETCFTTTTSGSFGKIIATLFAFEFISDLCLIAGPLIILWRIKFSTTERALILSLFSSSVLTLMASILYCVLYYATSWRGRSDSRLLFTVMGHIQVCISMVAANLLVVTMLVYKSRRKKHPVVQRPARPRVDSVRTPETPGPAQSQNSPDPRAETTQSRRKTTILSLTALSEFSVNRSSPMDAYGQIAGRSLSGASQKIQLNVDTSSQETEESADRV